MTITERDTRKRFIINRHIAKMTPEEIARRFTIAYTEPVPITKKGQTRRIERRDAVTLSPIP